MSRSSYVYVVQRRRLEDQEVLAAFTVKHELETWLRKYGHAPVPYGIAVIRVRACDQQTYIMGKEDLDLS
jgi:hypothetical protein